MVDYGGRWALPQGNCVMVASQPLILGPRMMDYGGLWWPLGPPKGKLCYGGQPALDPGTKNGGLWWIMMAPGHSQRETVVLWYGGPWL